MAPDIRVLQASPANSTNRAMTMANHRSGSSTCGLRQLAAIHRVVRSSVRRTSQTLSLEDFVIRPRKWFALGTANANGFAFSYPVEQLSSVQGHRSLPSFGTGSEPQKRARPQRCCARSGGLLPSFKGVWRHAVPLRAPTDDTASAGVDHRMSDDLVKIPSRICALTLHLFFTQRFGQDFCPQAHLLV